MFHLGWSAPISITSITFYKIRELLQKLSETEFILLAQLQTMPTPDFHLSVDIPKAETKVGIDVILVFNIELGAQDRSHEQ